MKYEAKMKMERCTQGFTIVFKNYKLLGLLMLQALCIGFVHAQADSLPVGNDKLLLINSAVLKEQRTIWIHLPEDYATTMQTYPTLYLLDGEGHFKYVSAMVDYLSGYDRNRIPPMIVIAVLNVDRTRDFTPIHSLFFGGKD